MLRVTKKIEYGIIAILYLAQQENQSASVREMASTCGIPETLLSKIMQSMKAQGLVQPMYGNQGGYKLVRHLNEINLLEITQMLQGPIQVTECVGDSENSCPVKESCTIISPMNILNQKIVNLFQSTSLEALAHRKTAV
jgi:Rrf2 family protein